ncbi:hypothetical protein Shyhy02_41120 [Streptomyces hygroscopicus subsp. hygroscopicus]|nr:hypothetical protein Shyhy02_41120 [Streptomyces hygroscopicus subsp. hygroscopicus]
MVSRPSPDPGDPAYRRLRYIRYADDHLLGFTGPKAEAEQIKQRLTQFLRDELKLELSQEKTLITHARTGAPRFLGYEITTQHNATKKTAQNRNPEPGTRQSGQGDLLDPSPKCDTALSRVRCRRLRTRRRW